MPRCAAGFLFATSLIAFVVDQLAVMRGLGKSFSDVILRLTEVGVSIRR